MCNHVHLYIPFLSRQAHDLFFFWPAFLTIGPPPWYLLDVQLLWVYSFLPVRTQKRKKMSGRTHSFSFKCDMPTSLGLLFSACWDQKKEKKCQTGLIRTHLCVWHDWFIDETWLIHMRDMTHSHVCIGCATTLGFFGSAHLDTTHSYVTPAAGLNLLPEKVSDSSNFF